QDSGLGSADFGSIQNDQFTRCILGRERVAQAEFAELLVQVMGVAARSRALVSPAVPEDRRFLGTVACAAGALLAIDLLGGVAHIRTAQRRVGALLCGGTLPAHDAVQNVHAWFQTKDGIVEFDGPGGSAVEL